MEDVYRVEPKHTGKRLMLKLPIPPSINSIYYNTRGGGRRLTNKAEKYIRDVKALINLGIEEQRWIKPDKHIWLYVDMVYYFPDRRIRDSHNCLKILMDALEGSVFHNDYTALPRIQSVEYDKECPRVEIAVSPQLATHREKGLRVTNVG
jgi:crossover junction endodeoxyribonuclease RusA